MDNSNNTIIPLTNYNKNLIDKVMQTSDGDESMV